MVDIPKNIDNIKFDYIDNLSEQGLEQLLQNLSRKYYIAYVGGDVAKMESIMEFIKEIEFAIDNITFDFNGFVNYCMLCNANFIIQTLVKHDIELNPYANVPIKSNGGLGAFGKAFERNKYAFIGSEDRINIKKLYGLCNADDSIDADIIAVVDALYCSFIDKEKHNDVGGR